MKSRFYTVFQIILFFTGFPCWSTNLVTPCFTTHYIPFTPLFYFQQIDDAQGDEKTDTDKNMATMFGILRRNKHVRLESLMLNRKSFDQTVENLFALSFLVKDGRAEISLDAHGSHFVCKAFLAIKLNVLLFVLSYFHPCLNVCFLFPAPRNAPASNSVMSKQVSYSHFVFRYDFEDWKVRVVATY